MTLTVVLYDDRPQALTGLKLASLSLVRTSPGLDVRVSVPPEVPGFAEWAARHRITVMAPIELRARGWDVKPAVLLHLLDSGAEQVLWVDTDIIATADIRPLLARFDPDTLVATEEYYWGHHQGTPVRTLALDRAVGRVLPRSVNSGVLRVSARHRELLVEWARILASSSYREAQDRPVAQRPVVYLGDQEVLGGLLGAREYADIRLGQLRRGVDIAQCFGPSGFTVGERWRARHRLPPLIHAMGRKPWSRPPRRSGTVAARMAAAWENAHLDLTPYLEAARGYLPELDEPTDWAEPVTSLGRALARVPSAALREVPLAAVDTAQRGLRRRLGIGQVPA